MTPGEQKERERIKERLEQIAQKWADYHNNKLFWAQSSQPKYAMEMGYLGNRILKALAEARGIKEPQISEEKEAVSEPTHVRQKADSVPEINEAGALPVTPKSPSAPDLKEEQSLWVICKNDVPECCIKFGPNHWSDCLEEATARQIVKAFTASVTSLRARIKELEEKQ